MSFFTNANANSHSFSNRDSRTQQRAVIYTVATAIAFVPNDVLWLELRWLGAMGLELPGHGIV